MHEALALWMSSLNAESEYEAVERRGRTARRVAACDSVLEANDTSVRK